MNVDAPAAIIFDLDGTLIDSRADIAAAANAVRQRLGRPALAEETVGGYVGDGARKLLERVLAHPDDQGPSATPPDSAALDAALAMFLEIYGAHVLDRTGPYPGIRSLLAGLSDRPLFLATNKPRALTLPILAGLGWADIFARVVAGDDPPQRKPHPDHLRACLEGYELAPDAVAMVGDSPNDIAPARALGMRAIAVGWGLVDVDRLAAAGPDALVTDAAALAAALGADTQL